LVEKRRRRFAFNLADIDPALQSDRNIDVRQWSNPPKPSSEVDESDDDVQFLKSIKSTRDVSVVQTTTEQEFACPPSASPMFKAKQELLDAFSNTKTNIPAFSIVKSQLEAVSLLAILFENALHYCLYQFAAVFRTLIQGLGSSEALDLLQNVVADCLKELDSAESIQSRLKEAGKEIEHLMKSEIHHLKEELKKAQKCKISLEEELIVANQTADRFKQESEDSKKSLEDSAKNIDLLGDLVVSLKQKIDQHGYFETSQPLAKSEDESKISGILTSPKIEEELEYLKGKY
jgi:hypothetical protein